MLHLRILTIIIIVLCTLYACQKEYIKDVSEVEEHQELSKCLKSNKFNNKSAVPWVKTALFDGTLDLTNTWRDQYPWGQSPYVPNICENKRTCRLPTNLIIQNSALKIRTDKGPKVALANDGNYYTYDWESGRIYSRESFKYGYFEIDCKVPSGDGIGAAFWLFSGNDEIDIFEHKGWEGQQFPTNYHRDNYSRSYELELGPNDIPGSPDFTRSFNCIGLEWTPSKIAWYVNDHLVREATEDIPISSELFIVADVNCPTRNICPTPTTTFPVDFQIKEISYYDQRPVNAQFLSTSVNGVIQELKSFTKWRDSWTHAIPGDFDDDNITDILLYDKNSGNAQFFNSSGLGPSFNNWRTTWDIIIPGNFDGTGNTDLLFYDSQAGEGAFYKVISNSGMNVIQSYTGWRSTWEIIVPGDFDNDNITDILLYDKINGDSEFRNSLGMNPTFNNWRTTWDIIIPGNFDGTGNTDLLFYDSQAGEGIFHKVISNSGMNTIQSFNNWRTTWTKMIPGDFDNDNLTDILMYDASDSHALFYNSSLANRTYNNWRSTWDLIVSGNFDGVSNSDILLYDN